jgi:hypothetical protein
MSLLSYYSAPCWIGKTFVWLAFGERQKASSQDNSEFNNGGPGDATVVESPANQIHRMVMARQLLKR